MQLFFLRRRVHQWSVVLSLLIGPCSVFSQGTINVDGKEFVKARPAYFKPHRGLFYSVYISPVVTVDPLAFGGKSTFGASLGSKFNLWESKTPESPLTGLKIRGFYTAIGYEYYPKQYDKAYASIWMRCKAIIPLSAKADAIYATGYGLKGFSARYCVGFEVGVVTIFLCGEVWYSKALEGPHPVTRSPYTNAGEIMAVVPLWTRKEK